MSCVPAADRLASRALHFSLPLKAGHPGPRRRDRRLCSCLQAALLPLPPAVAAAATAAARLPLAAVVPTFPRVGGQPERDWIGQLAQQLEGFNANDLARLLFPDLVGLVDTPTLLVGALLLLAFVYWEGGILLRQLREWQRRQRERRRRQKAVQSGEMSVDEAEAAAAAEAATPPPQLLSPLDRARHERRRGLGWLALVTAGLIWMTGAVSGPNPLQP